MCGIAGVVSTDPGREPVRREMAMRMAETLRHRGPDGLRGYADPRGRCAFGHTRLGVIDLEGGVQPMPNEDGTVHLVFNGEIYNFQQLRRRLEERGHRFRSRCDTEVIVHGYEEWGESVVERLDGMFAFGVWDERRSRLLLARDRAGQKPLFVYRNGSRLAFASEMKAILALPDVDDGWNRRALPLYLAYGYVPAPYTFYERIHKLPPASTLLLDPDDGERSRRYWRLDFTPSPDVAGRSDGRTAPEELRHRMEGAVKRRLVADVPLGAFLSGGIDSSVVVGVMSRLTDVPVRTFAIGFEDAPAFDETDHARRVADHFDTDHTEFRVGAQSVDLLRELVRAYDEPFGDSSAIPTYIVSRLTRKRVTVALTGDGGDELFAGYLRLRAMRIADALPGWAATLGRAVTSRLPHVRNRRSPVRRAARFFRAAELPEAERMLHWVGHFPDGGRELLRPELRDRVVSHELLRSLREPLARAAGLPPLARTLALNFETYLPEDLLVKADRCSMAHGLELRAPFLDTGLMEWAASLPDRYRIRGTTLKWILREAYGDLLPPEILGRGKMGFGIPLARWLRTGWRPLLEERILAADARIYEWLRPEPVRNLVSEHLAARADHGERIWLLLTLEEWLRSGPSGSAA